MGARIEIPPNKTAPAAIAIIMRAVVLSAPRFVAMKPAPVTAVTMPAVPRNSAKSF